MFSGWIRTSILSITALTFGQSPAFPQVQGKSEARASVATKQLKAFECEDCNLACVPSDDGHLVVFSEGSQVLTLVDTELQRRVKTLRLQEPFGSCFSMPSSTNQLLITTSLPLQLERKFYVWDLTQNRLTNMTKTADRLEPLAMLDSSTLIGKYSDNLTQNTGDRLVEVKLPTWSQRALFRAKGSSDLSRLSISTDRHYLAWLEFDSEQINDVVILKVGSTEPVRIPLGPRNVSRYLGFLPNSNDIVLHCGNLVGQDFELTGQAITYSATDGHVINKFAIPQGDIAVSSMFVAIARPSDTAVDLHDVRSGDVLGSISDQDAFSLTNTRIGFAPDSKHLLVYGWSHPASAFQKDRSRVQVWAVDLANNSGK